MPLFTLGLNHKTAPVDVRERVTFAPEKIGDALRELRGLQGVDEAAIVSTCNRTEIYCGIDADSANFVGHWLRDYHQLDAKAFDPYIFQYADKDAVKHLLRVSCGLDSLVLGEPQILGQIKTAFHAAGEAGALGHQLNRLFQHAFSVAKQVRTDTEIGHSPVSVAFAAVRLGQQIFGNLSAFKALLIGAGDTIELALRHLSAQGIGEITIANRTLERAQILGAPFNARGVHISQIPDELPKADIVISSTASNLPILGKGAVERALKIRKHRPMLMVDIAVPRDIEPQVGELDDVFLYTVDDMDTVIEESLASRREAAAVAEEIIDSQVDRFMAWLRSLDTITTLKAYRQQAERTRDQVIADALHMLEQDKTPQEVVEYLGRVLTNKLLHSPTQRIRQAGEEGQDDLVAAARELFALKDESA